MPNLGYQYHTLAGIQWPAPGTAVGGGVTTCGGLPSSALPGLGNPLGLTVAELLYATLICGAFPVGWVQQEFEWRAATFTASVAVDGANDLVTTPIYDQIDPQERTTMSFMVGQTFASVVAMQIEAFPFIFMPWDRFLAATGIAPNYRSAHRPDFISLYGPGAQIWEAKVRQTGGLPGHLRNAFDQAYSVNTLGMAGAPDAHIACVSRVHGGLWRANVTDPPDTKSMNLSPGARDAFYTEYYRPWRWMLADSGAQSQSVNYAGCAFTAVQVRPADFSIGVDQGIRQAFSIAREKPLKPGELSDLIELRLADGFQNTKTQRRFASQTGLYTAIGDRWAKQWKVI